MVSPITQRRTSFAWSIFLCLVRARTAIGEDIANAYEQEQTDDGLGRGDDWVFVVLVALLFAFFISLFGSFFGSVTYMDDAIMQRYKEEADVVQADVISTEFARGGAGDGDVCFEPGQKEYCVIVEYDHLMPDNYRIRIRKQLRAMESDFVHLNHVGLDFPTSNDAKGDKNRTPRRSNRDKAADIESQRNSARVIFNKDAYFQKFLVEERKLELLVLDGHPKSGFSARQLKRRLSLRYRMSSMAFVLSAILVTLLCFLMAVRAIEDTGQSSGWIMVLSFAVLILLQGPCIHFTLRKSIQESLQEEYFEAAEVLQTGQDDSSLSSGSDSFLCHHYRSMDSGMKWQEGLVC
jgi:hypothetical protein